MEEKANDPNIQLDEEETEDTLSFCDLPIYSGTAAAEWSKENQRLSTSSALSDQDLFEFFSEEWRSNSSTYPVHHNIVFCGKILPLHETISHTTQSNKTQKQKPQKLGFFQWNTKFFRSRRRAKTCVSLHKCGYNKVGKGGGEKCGFSVRRVSILSKPRWQLMMFGLARLPTEMELSDIKSRQRRRCPAALFPLRGGGDGDGDEKVKKGNGLWGLFRSLSCGGGRLHRRANAVVIT